MIQIFNNAGQPISRSKNLRGPQDRCSKVRPARVEVTPVTTGGARVYVQWVDDSWAVFVFASYDVAIKWQNTRRFADAARVTAPQIKVGGAA